MYDGTMIYFESGIDSYSLVFEDDGKVAYVYLKEDNPVNGPIVGDLWLYNRCPTPEVPEWRNHDKIPYANPKMYVGEGGRMLREVHLGDVIVTWEQDQRGPVAYVYIFENLYGFLGVGDRPGYARYAIKDGPLAKVIEIEGAEDKVTP